MSTVQSVQHNMTALRAAKKLMLMLFPAMDANFAEAMPDVLISCGNPIVHIFSMGNRYRRCPKHQTV